MKPKLHNKILSILIFLVLIIGAGGVGSPAALYLAAAGIADGELCGGSPVHGGRGRLRTDNVSVAQEWYGVGRRRQCQAGCRGLFERVCRQFRRHPGGHSSHQSVLHSAEPLLACLDHSQPQVSRMEFHDRAADWRLEDHVAV